MRRWSAVIRSPLGVLLAALLLPGGLVVLAWILYRRLTRKRCISVGQHSATPVSCVLTSPAPQHGPRPQAPPAERRQRESIDDSGRHRRRIAHYRA
jgi:hypothetical protein